MTNQKGAPEALAHELFTAAQLAPGEGISDAVARIAAMVEAQQPATHVQQSAEIEHVAGGVSKNGPESNMAQQPAPTPQADSQPAPVLDERDDFEKAFPLPSGCIRVGTGYASTGYSNWAAHTHVERWQGWQARAARAPADSVTAPAYSIDADPQGIRARVAEAITGALAFGAQGANPPPTGHWLVPFWETAREEASRNRPVSSDTLYLLRRLLSNQHTLTSAEFREELTKIVGEAAQAADSVLEDAARYRCLRDTSNADDPSHMIALHIRDEQNDTSLSGIDAAIDAAIAAQREVKP